MCEASVSGKEDLRQSQVTGNQVVGRYRRILGAVLRFLCSTLVALFLPLAGLWAQKAPIDLGAAGPKNWAVLSLGGPTTVTMSGGSVVNGAVPNVGVPATGNLQLSGGSTISGKGYVNAAGQSQVSNNSVITGGVVRNADILLNQASTDALAASTRIAALVATMSNPATINISSPAQNLTITGVAGVNVLKLTDLILSKGTLTLNAPAGGVFILNISGRFQLSNQSQIALAATVAPLAVVFNITGTGQDVTIGDKSPVTGILLAPRRNVLLSSALIFTGEILAGGPTLSLSGGAQVTNPYLPPTITSTAAPPPNAAGWNNTNVTVTFACADAIAGIYSCPASVLVSMDGGNQVISGTAIDNTGGTASASSIVNLDKTAPQITSKVAPVPNAAGWNNTNPTVTFICADTTSGVASCSPPVTVTTETVGQVVTGTATDKAGNTATAPVTIKLDKTPPLVTVTSPANGSTVTTSPVALAGTVTDVLSGLSGLTCNGTAATVTGNSFTCSVTLTPGANTIAIRGTDIAGNISTPPFTLTYVPAAPAPSVTFTAPANLSYLNISPTTVTGTVSDPMATVVINSVPAVVANGQFSTALPLAEGPNIITATATDTAGVGTASIQVTLDTTPPHVTITSPPDKFVTTDTSTSVAGNINDIVVGTVNDQQAQVTVNGIAAQVANRTFLATNVPLNIGDNIIQAVGSDRAGNAATTQITVTRQTPSPSQIRLISGNNQNGTIGSVLQAPLVVALTDASGNPAPNKPVIFKVTQDDGSVSAGGAPAASVVATTNAQGQAQAQWTLGQRAGAGGNVVEAYSVGFGGTAIFTATGNQGPAGKIVIDTGNNQVGAINQSLPKPLIAVVIDAGNNRLANVPVTFTVKTGGGSLSTQGSASFTLTQGGSSSVGQTSVTVSSDSDGRVAAILTLGFQEGDANNLVEANFVGNQGFPAAFTASGRAPGDPSKTTISGVVLDNSNVPIPGVTVRAVLTNLFNSNSTSVQSAADVQTNAQGQFIIPQAPVGFVKLLVDGSTAQLPGKYPALDYDLVTVAGQNNTVTTPIYLLSLNAANQLCVTGTTGGGTLTIPEAPGFSLTFGPGQVTFPGGSKSGCVSVTAVHGDKVPMTPGFGQQPRFIVTIQPAGALFNPPAPITLPNVDGLKPREVTEMYSFDHDIGSFVAIGTGTVSDDGGVIRSNRGTGVLKAGWHCGGNPTSTGSAATCPNCQICQGSNCVPDPAQDGLSTAAGGACCWNGSTIPLQAASYTNLTAMCPNRTQDNRLHEVDGCSVPGLVALLTPGLSVQNPVGGVFGLAATDFGRDQGTISTSAGALPLPCNQHDICYQSCGSSQSSCDTGMYQAMTNVCNAAYPSASCPYSGLEAVAKCVVGNPLTGSNYFTERVSCAFWASTYKAGLDSFGISAWQQRQVDYCQCCR